ncbi:2TM domain-containing protein [Flagellimonas pacifica]|uniref:2TM domain-containing protein n=1 Tax=Flagellimonas pacifica TaxID=1247520 RepID=A0A285MUY8_9FLAO|nr:2TM domain-containing protein [Allomuricauda parva]SNZ00513.1 2TM domain-containing protein [Allomuricauda parva]
MEAHSEYKYQRAKERVKELKCFYTNLLAYCLVIPFLAYTNYSTTNFIWFVFPAFGWGLGLLLHGMKATGYNPFLGNNWEERKIREFMGDDKF